MEEEKYADRAHKRQPLTPSGMNAYAVRRISIVRATSRAQAPRYTSLKRRSRPTCLPLRLTSAQKGILGAYADRNLLKQ